MLAGKLHIVHGTPSPSPPTTTITASKKKEEDWAKVYRNDKQTGRTYEMKKCLSHPKQLQFFQVNRDKDIVL